VGDTEGEARSASCTERPFHSEGEASNCLRQHYTEQAALERPSQSEGEASNCLEQHYTEQAALERPFHSEGEASNCLRQCLRRCLRHLIVESPAMKEKLLIVERIAGTNSSVWITGESGVGKALIAEQIHIKSPRGENSFIRVNCARKDLVSFSASGTFSLVFDKGRAIHIPAGATVFFDEIACLSLPLQETILHVLNKKSEPNAPLEAPLPRIIASTRSDIENMVGQGTFIRELYYKLNVLPIYIPPLRDRKEDIMPLADHFLAVFALDMKKRAEGWTSAAKEAFLSHPWTGNVRELKNVVERALLNSSSLLLDKRDDFFYTAIDGDGCDRVGECGRDLKKAVAVFKASFIRNVLQETRGNQTEAAKLLGIQRTYLSKLMKDIFSAKIEKE
jgi:Nif-specific regulatory protein